MPEPELGKPLRARGRRAPDPRAPQREERAVIERSVAVAAGVRDDVDAAHAAARGLQAEAEALVAEHGRTLVRLQRARRDARAQRLRAEEHPVRSRDAPGDGLARTTGLALLTQVTTALGTAALTLFLIRALDPDEYGLFSLALAIIGLLLLPADFGISGSAARFIAESRAVPRAVAAILADALRLKLALALVVALGVVALAGPIAAVFDSPGLAWPLRAMAVALVGQSVMALFTSGFLAVGRVASNLRLVASESIVELSASVALVLLGAGATGAALGRSTGYAVGAVAGAVLAARAFGRAAVRPGLRPRHRDRRLVRYAGALFVVDGAFALFNQVDILIIGRILGGTAVGLFAAPLRLCTVLHYPGLAVSNAVAPRVARALGHVQDTRAFSAALRILIVLQIAIAVPVLVWAEPIVNLLLGPQYAESVPVMRALTPYIVLQGLGPLITVSVNYLGQARRRVPIAIAAVTVNIAIDVILIPRIGIVGGAIGTSVAYAIYVPAHFLVCRRELALDVRPLALTTLRALTAGAAMAVPLLLAGTSELTAQQWIAGGTASLAAFAAALLATGEVRLRDVRAAASRLPRRRARRA